MQFHKLIVVCLFLYFPLTALSQNFIETENYRQNISARNQFKENYMPNSSRIFSDFKSFNNPEIKTEVNKTLLDNGFLLSEELELRWDGTDWVNSEKYSYSYDSNNNMTDSTYQYWNGTEWGNQERRLYSYDSNNNRAEFIRQQWNYTDWVNDVRFSYSYDSNNNMTELLHQKWRDTDWVNESKYSFSYDSNNYRTELIYQQWNGTNWVNVIRYAYSYDSNNMTERILQSWNDTDWVIYARYSYSHDSNNNITIVLFQRWRDNNWADELKDSYSYDSNSNMTEFIHQQWRNNEWKNQDRRSWSYDNNNMSEELSQYWNGTWVNSGKYSYSYNSNNYMTESIYQNWNDADWAISRKILYSYSPITNINDEKVTITNYSLSNNYPNPFNPATTIKYSLPAISELAYSESVDGRQYPVSSIKHQTNVSLKIYDILGREVATLVNEHQRPGQYEVKWDASGFPSGVYFYKLTAGSFSETRKMVLLL